MVTSRARHFTVVALNEAYGTPEERMLSSTALCTFGCNSHLFWYMRSQCCLPLFTPSVLNAWPDLYENSYVYDGTWTHPNAVLHKSHPSVCAPLCISTLDFHRDGLTETFPRQPIHATVGEMLEAFFTVRSVSYRREFVGVCVTPLPLLSNVSLDTFLLHRLHATEEESLEVSFSVRSV
jgi:hypothetical protein